MGLSCCSWWWCFVVFNALLLVDVQVSAACAVNLRNRKLGTINETYLRAEAAIACGALENVTTLDLSNNKLTGSLQALLPWPSMTQLEALNLYKNALDGGLGALSSLTMLRKLNLGNNKLTGTLAGLAELTELTELRLYNNVLLNGILRPLSPLKKLQTLYINNNAFTGNLSFLSNMTEMKLLNVGNSAHPPTRSFLTGSLDSLQNMSKLVKFIASHNDLEGTLAGLMNKPALAEVELACNNLSGDLKPLASVAQLRKVQLQNNRFTGTMEGISHLRNLVNLDISGNQLFQNMSEITIDLPYVPVVNISWNNFKARITKLNLPTKAMVDLRGNTCYCKYPASMDLRSLLSIKDPCNNDKELSWLSMAGLALLVGVLVLLLLYRLAKKWRSNATYKARIWARFLSTQFMVWFDLASDIRMSLIVIRYAKIRDTHCAAINDPNIFLRMMPITFSNWKSEAQVTSLANYKQQALQSPTGKAFPFFVDINYNHMANFCSGLSKFSCEYDRSNSECISVIDHSWFANLAIAFLFIYIIKEVFKSVMIIYFLTKESTPPKWKGWCRSSPLCCLLLLKGRNRLLEVARYDKSYKDLLWDAVLDGLMEGFPQMGLNIYFLFGISTTGLGKEELALIFFNMLANAKLLLEPIFKFFVTSPASIEPKSRRASESKRRSLSYVVVSSCDQEKEALAEQRPRRRSSFKRRLSLAGSSPRKRLSPLVPSQKAEREERARRMSVPLLELESKEDTDAGFEGLENMN